VKRERKGIRQRLDYSNMSRSVIRRVWWIMSSPFLSHQTGTCWYGSKQYLSIQSMQESDRRRKRSNHPSHTEMGCCRRRGEGHLVDERIVAHKPESLDAAQTAAGLY
jgi:hypothetical protein